MRHLARDQVGVFVPWGLNIELTNGCLGGHSCNTPTALARLAKGLPQWCDPRAPR